ncbi:hypothetical protein IM660_10145 [Ruania alkalisoli]|uniref:Universal stress protein n=1 Tax=Ruania alkalisoli TaxID=2779775 RepID=A0A7M1SNG6_9MICO|nr:hypothetical protein [Ruania alkalisoli]QOR69099.1 hypothetical protein IM660_10145 [Ruania alkalisoli]
MALIIVLTEEALQESDVAAIGELHDAPGTRFHVLVPQDTERNLVTDFIDHLSLFELKEAWDELTHRPDPQQARAEADDALATSLQRFEAAGTDAEGAVIADDPIPALRQAVNGLRADEVVVVTRPHAVEDTFHRDWASRARESLGLPVLHLYSGTNRLG